MPARWPGWVATAFLGLFVLFYAQDQVRYAIDRGDHLTGLFDAYSEANGIRAGEGFADQGFTSNRGLADIAYGPAFETQGSKHDPNMCSNPDRCVYLHYPPGPDWVIGISTKMCGKGKIPCIRMAPIVFGIFALAFFAWAVARVFGVVRSAFVIGSFVLAPMTTNGMHHLHYHSYVVSLLYIQVGVLLIGYRTSTNLIRRFSVCLGFVGFLYGFLSFDYCFHVALLAIAIWLIQPNPRALTRRMLIFTASACSGYFIANLLHFWQVASFLGSASAAFSDLAARGSIRLAGNLEGVRLPSWWELIGSYWTRVSESPFLRFPFLPVCLCTFLALSLKPIEFRLFRRAWQWAPRPSFKWAFLIAFAIPHLWLLLMRQHATIHGHFLPRNFIVTFVIGSLVWAAGWQCRPFSPTNEFEPR